MNAADERWDTLVGQFRQLCLLRRQKKWIESDIILTSDLPRAIAAWSETAEADPATKKSRLDAMFQTEQRRIEDACFTMDLLTDRLKDEIIPSICAQVTEQVRATVLQELRASVTEQISAATAELRSTHHFHPSQPEPAESAPVSKQDLVSNFAEQVRTTVAQQAYDAVLEELAREKKPAPAPKKTYSAPILTPKPAPIPKPARSSRIPMEDISAAIDFVLAEEQQSLKTKYKFELSACP
ncbi:MAG TPA: hypothetical protein VI282_07830 [Verrucomicrobiae bacterium]